MQQQWQDFGFTAFDGLKLAGRKYGWEQRSAPVVVCLAGLTRNSADFHEVALYLASREKHPFRVLTLDYRGRGRSQYDPDWQNYNVQTEARDVLAGLDAAGVGVAGFIGTSRGGLILHVLAATRPGALGAIVFNDIAPEIDGPGLVRIKKYVERGTDPANWAEAKTLLRETIGGSFPAFDDAMWDKQARLIFREENGKLIRDYDPKLANTMKALDLDVPLPVLWPQFAGLVKVPLMTIRGEKSDLVTPEIIERMRKMHPSMRHVEVAGQGHAPDLGTAGLPEKIAGFFETALPQGSH